MEVLKGLPERLNETMKVSRRGFLKGFGALSATAAIYGCGGGENLASFKSEPSVTPSDNLVLDKELKTVMISHPYNCGGRCLMKIHVKNGKMLKITSGVSDTPRAGVTTRAEDESIDKPQHRPCIRGYAGIKRTYAPDRLKYPMKQTLERGNLRGFKRISWDEATDTIAGWHQEMTARSKVLGYLPAVQGGNTTLGLLKYLGPWVLHSGAPSHDNFKQGSYAVFGTIGANSNALADYLNSKFILNIGCDVTASTSQGYPNHWYFTKAKEMGIPIVTIDPRFTDTAKAFSTGYSKYNLPKYINIRPATDGALLSAMANVIYRKGLHDATFIKDYCFGFNKGDTVVSQSTGKNPVTGVAYAGQTFTTPTGMSFVEYLDGLEAKNGGYSGVLNWASQITGIPATTIENLGLAYASTKPSCLHGGYGVYRNIASYQGAMLLCVLAAMTGNTNKVGGGPGYSYSSSDPGPVTLGATKDPVTTAPTVGAAIVISANAFSNVAYSGTDWRTPEQLRADVLALNKIDLGAWKAQRDDVNGHDGRLRIEMLEWGNVQKRGSVQKLLVAMKKIKYMYSMDPFLATVSSFSDIVLPIGTCVERNEFQSIKGSYFFSNKAIEPMYEAKEPAVIAAEVAKKLGINIGKYGPQGDKTDRDLMKEQWDGAKVSAAMLAINPSATLPSFEDFSTAGVFQLPIPAAKAPLNSFAALAAGKFASDTGRIQFFSPFYFNRDKSLGDAYKKPDGGYYRSTNPPKAHFGPPSQGFDPVTGAFKGYHEGVKVKNGQKLRYTLQMLTPHERQTAHTVFDNVPVIKLITAGRLLVLNASDAAARGINDGDEVYVYNDRGCLKVTVTVSKRPSIGTVSLKSGTWYRASTTETYEALLDMDGDGVPEKYVLPVDVGGAAGTLHDGFDYGNKEPSFGSDSTSGCGDNSFNGQFVEVSKTHPEK